MKLTDLKTQYQSNNPFPHIVLDNFMHPFDASYCLDEMKRFVEWGADYTEYSAAHQQNKFFFPYDGKVNEFKDLMPFVWKTIQYYNSKEFIHQLEELTGIKNLIPDHDLVGGGVHRIDSGGKLSVHTDYGKHPEKEGLYRRINLLIYLNKDWNPDWGGTLQLWKPDKSEMMVEVQPTFNTAVIFNTSSKSLHGHPHPLNTPEGISRYSIALYYFTTESFEDNNTTAAQWYDV